MSLKRCIMKKYIAITIIIILAVLIYRERYMFRLGFDYLLSRSQTTTNIDPEKKQTLINPLEGFVETNEEQAATDHETPQEIPESVEISPQSPADTVDVTMPAETTKQDVSSPTTSEAIEKQSFDAIAARYNKELISLEKEFRSSLDGLIASAISDYNSGSYKKLELAKLYLKKGEDLEKSSDGKFYVLLKAFESELKDNGYSIDLIKDVDKYYVAMKKTEKTRIVDTGMSIVNN